LVLGNDVARIRIAREPAVTIGPRGVWIVNDWKACSAEIAATHVRCEQAVKRPGVGIAISEAIVIRIEERLVAAIVNAWDQDRSTSFDAELVLAVLGDRGGKEIPRV